MFTPLRSKGYRFKIQNNYHEIRAHLPLSVELNGISKLIIFFFLKKIEKHDAQIIKRHFVTYIDFHFQKPQQFAKKTF